MDSEDVSMAEKCEHLMNIVVDSRKLFGKRCNDYEQKISLMENKILNLQLETISNSHFKSKHPIPDTDPDTDDDIDNFIAEITNNQKRVKNLMQMLKNAKEIVSQLQRNNVNKRLQAPLTVEAMLSRAKSQNL